MTVSRRSFGSKALATAFATFLLTTGLLASGAQATSMDALYDAAKEEGELVFYTDNRIQLVEALVGAFNEKYPGIDVDFFRGDTAQVMQRFETESGARRHVADFVTSTDRQSKQLLKKGFSVPYKSSHIDMYPAELHAPNNGWSYYALVTLGIAWNTDMVKGDDAPKSWNDVLDPKWKGKIGMQDPLQGGGAGIWVVTMNKLWGDSQWNDFMKSAGAQQIRYGRYLEVREMLASGEVAIQMVAYPSFTQPIIDKGAPIEWALIDPALFTGLTFNLSANAPHPNAAKLYIDFVLSLDGQKIIAENNQIPALPDLLPPVYSRMKEVKLFPQAHELEVERFDYFQEKMREHFVR